MKSLAAAVLMALSVAAADRQPAPIAVDYPLEGSVFPPEFTAPLFQWRDDAARAVRWRIDIEFPRGGRAIHVLSGGPMLELGEIDRNCISNTNKLPELTPEQARTHTWRPDEATWQSIKRLSADGPASITITGFDAKDSTHPLSRGRVSISTSKDQVGAPVFYRDVPLMPSETEKGIIKPLAPDAIRLIEWKLRNLGEPASRVVMSKMPTCANCHSFSNDGRTMGMDMDGPANDKGLYAVVPVHQETVIDTKDMVSWDPNQDRQVGLNRVGFMSQVSPDGRYILTSVTPKAGGPAQNNFYVVNFKDYRFLQVFYPTRGILAWYDRRTGERHPLPGADDPRYVQTDGVWSPDGKYIVFARAEARAPYPPDGKMAERANDPQEVQIQYDLYRVPFNEGRGGEPERIEGASANGMSNNFPKVSPDGKWIVFVQCRNGQLMRPDSQLFIVPFAGGAARRLRANTALMNSWHSFSPNSRWLVFSSKARSPYTRMYLTHIDPDGSDSPAILIENTTAANRAVNLPEFVNMPQDGLRVINTPAVEEYRRFDQALELERKGEHQAAIDLWNELLAKDPDNARMITNLGSAIINSGRLEEGIRKYERALEINPQLAPALTSLARALVAAGRLNEAIPRLRTVLEMYPESVELHNDLGRAQAMAGRFQEAAAAFARAVEIKPDFLDARYYLGMSLYYLPGKFREALAQWREALRIDPNCVHALNSLAHALATAPDASERNGAEAVQLAERAVGLTRRLNPAYMDTLGEAYAEAGQFPEAVAAATRALDLFTRQDRRDMIAAVRARIRLYESKAPYRSAPGTEP